MQYTPFYILQSALGDISETTVLSPVPYHVTGVAVVKSVIVQIRYATVFTDAITETVRKTKANLVAKATTGLPIEQKSRATRTYMDLCLSLIHI